MRWFLSKYHRYSRRIAGVGQWNIWTALVWGGFATSSLILLLVPLWLEAPTMPLLMGVSASWILLAAIIVRFVTDAITRLWSGPDWSDQRRLRKITTQQALADLAKIIAQGPDGAVTFNRIEEHVLEAICSHAAHHSRSPQDILGANLLLVDGDYLVVTARHRGGRATPVRYRRTDLFCSEALEKNATLSVGDIRRWRGPQREVDYRDVLAMPLLGVFSGDEGMGVVTIDSRWVYHFDGMEEQLAKGLGPYVNLLKVLVLLQRRGGGTER